jgi:hypothetical protein
VGNVQQALLVAGGPREIDPAEVFVEGGQWVPRDRFIAAASAGSSQAALAVLTTALHGSPLVSSLPVVAGDIAQMDRVFLTDVLARLKQHARLEPLGTAPILLLLLRLAAQSRDLRTLAWGAALGTPPLVRKAHLVTPS